VSERSELHRLGDDDLADWVDLVLFGLEDSEFWGFAVAISTVKDWNRVVRVRTRAGFANSMRNAYQSIYTANCNNR
jgi:hypothetical protein